MPDTSTKENILKTLLYYHIFNHPLTLDEIYYFHQNTRVTRRKIKSALHEIVSEKNGMIGELNGFYYIKPNKSCATERLKKENISRKKWKIAKLASLFIKRVPFVRGIFVTGTLSKNSSDVNSDIDFLIICRENRLWIARTILRLFAKIFLLTKNKDLCFNYFISEKNLGIEDRNIFTATELAHIKVMYNTKILDRFLRSNKWMKQYLPVYPKSNGLFNFPVEDIQTRDVRSILQPFFEIFFPGKFGDAIDEFLQKRTQIHLKRKFGAYDNLEQKQSFVLSSRAAKIHGTIAGDHKRKILDKYQALLHRYKIFERKMPITAANHRQFCDTVPWHQKRAGKNINSPQHAVFSGRS